MQYVKECLLLLYWIYFKPYTLKQHVRKICPEITNPYFDNYYRRSAEAKANPRLQRYYDQCWWLAALAPMIAVFLCGPLVEGMSRLLTGPAALQFNWWMSSFFLLGWLLGQVFVLSIQNKLREKRALLFYIAAILFLAFFGVLLEFLIVDSFIKDAMFVLAGGMAGGVAGGVAGGTGGGIAGVVAGGMAGSVMVGVAGVVAGVLVGSMTFVMTVGMVVGLAFGVAISVLFGVGIGVMYNMMEGGMVVSVVGGLAGSTAVIFWVLRCCFYLPELLWMLFLKLWPRPATAKLPCLPPQFDQLIYLPLPFLPGLITEAYQESPTDARSTINYLISSTNQQKAAAKAMLLIAAEEFRRCRKASDIAEVRELLNWLPADLTGKISLCLDLSQDTAAALEASSPFRQEERLKKVCAKIDQQRNALAGASAREATTLGAVLDQWQGILSTACRTLHETAQGSTEIPQVYLPGPPLEPDKAGSLFKGRRDLFRHIESLLFLALPPTLVMHGNRRSGKSSALRYLPKSKLMPPDILPLFVDCQHIGEVLTLSGFAEEFIDQLIRSARQLFELELPSPDKDKLANDPFVAMRHWLDAAEQAASSKTFLLCLDEFERIDEIVTATGSRAPLNFLRHLIQHRRCWQLLFAGSHTPEELAPHWSDCLINTRSLRVSCLDKADAVELICRPVPDFPDIWPEAAVEEVWRLTHGQPFLIQLLCQEAVEHLNRRKAKTVQPGDVAAILPAAFEHGHYYFDEFWRALTEDQRTLLAALAKGEEVPPELHAAAATLLRKEVLVQENSGYTFKVPLIREWIAAKL